MNSTLIALAVLACTHGGVGYAVWRATRTACELRESVQATEAYAADQKRSQRADVVAQGYAKWQQKQVAVVAVKETEVEKAVELVPDWAGTRVPAGVRAALAAAAITITTTEYLDDPMPRASAARPGDEPGAGAGVDRGAEGVDGLP